MGEPKYTTVHEMQSLRAAESPEWDAWRKAETPDGPDAVRPHMIHPPGPSGVYSRIFAP